MDGEGVAVDEQQGVGGRGLWGRNEVLSRIHNIDAVVVIIIGTGTTISAAILAAGMLLATDQDGTRRLVADALFVGGIALNVFVVAMLARQVWIRQWLAMKLGDTNLAPRRADGDWTRYVRRTDRIFGAIGAHTPGFVTSWIMLHAALALAFAALTIFL